MNLSEFFSAIWKRRYVRLVILIVLVIIAYIAAIARYQTLPWGIAALLLATLMTGILWPHWLIRKLVVERTGPIRAEEGQTIQFQVWVKNLGWTPRFMVEVVDHFPFVGNWRETLEPTKVILGLVAFIGPWRTRSFDVQLNCEKRGLYELGPVGLASSFPLDLHQAKQVKNAGRQSLIVYPDVFTIVDLPLNATPSEIHRGGFLLPEGSGAAEFSGMREYQRGDNPRHIHWPTTARMNQLMIKEFEPLASASLYLLLDLNTAANIGFGRHTSFEYAVRIAASIANYARINQIPFRCYGQREQALSLAFGSGDAHYRELLDMLAIVEANGTTSYATALQHAALNIRYGQTLVVFLSEPEHYVFETLQVIAQILASGAHVLAYVLDRSSFMDGDHSVATQQYDVWGGLIDLGVNYFTIRNGDDLLRMFNP